MHQTTFMYDWPKLATCVQTCLESSKTLQTSQSRPPSWFGRGPPPISTPLDVFGVSILGAFGVSSLVSQLFRPKLRHCTSVIRLSTCWAISKLHASDWRRSSKIWGYWRFPATFYVWGRKIFESKFSALCAVCKFRGDPLRDDEIHCLKI